MRCFFIILLLVSNISLAQITDVTFSVDMSNLIISEKGVHLAGDFQDWNPSSLEMFDTDNNSIYQLTISLEIDSVYEYKFINGDSWGEDEIIDDECGNGNGNRLLITSNESTNLETVCFSSCYSCDYVPETVEVTFQVDMTGYEVSNQGVHLAGSFQDWIPSTTQMYDLDNDSIYSITLSLLTNTTYEYKFINGNSWGDDEYVQGFCGEGNRVFTTSNFDLTLEISCFNSCYSCDYIPTYVNVNFYLDLSNEEISDDGVHIAADFLSWYPDAYEMIDLDNDSIYEFTISLLANSTYEYKYINGNTWGAAENVNGICGEGNRVLNTFQEDLILDTVCFASCDACPPSYIDVTFNLNMENHNINEDGVHLLGDFQNWTFGSTQMYDNDGIYSITLSLPTNTEFEYKFVNGLSFDLAENIIGPCGYGNRVLNTHEEVIVLDTVCFNSCFSCGEEPPLIEVLFQVDMTNENLSNDGVHIVGSFQDWNPSITEMLDLDSNGVYTATLTLMANTNYEYKFVNGNSWGQDEAVDGFCGNGNRNLQTLSEDMLLNPVCFNLCDVCPDFEMIPEGIVDGLNIIGDSSVIFSIFAPHKDFVHIIGDFNSWQENSESMMKKDIFADRFWIQIDGLDPNTEYRYQYSIDLNTLRIADIYSNKILDQSNDDWILEENWQFHPNYIPFPHEYTSGHVSCFSINDNDNYTWEVENFYKPEKEKLVIYELLIRDFIESQSYSDLIDSLDYLENLGINAVELMPVNEFEGNSSWGYNPSFYFAPDKAYGSIYDLKHFVDECHKRGIAVIMDIALNHSFGQNPQVQMYFDQEVGDYGTPTNQSPWFNQYPTHDFNVGYDYNHESAHTKYFCKRVFQYWIEEFKIDGFRLDLSKGYTQNQTIGNIDAWSSYDQSRVNILQEYGNHIWSVNPYTYVILEHFGDNNEEMVLANSGFMLWGKMHSEYLQATMGYGGDLSRAIYSNRGWNSPNLITYMESHDEERIMFSNLLYGNSYDGYDTKEFSIAIDRLKLAYTFLLLAPGPKMIWQFGELGYDYSIEYCEDGTLHGDCITNPKPSAWNYTQDSLRHDLYQFISAINFLKTKIEVFSSLDFSYDIWGEVKRITLSSSTGNATIIGNFSMSDMLINPNFQHTGQWFDYFTGESILEYDLDNQFLLSPGEYRVYTDFPISNKVDVTFQVNMQNEDISDEGVHLAGSFQGWNPSTTPMEDLDGDGIYSVTINLAVNSSYEYKFINGDSWGFDESVYGDCADNNRILSISDIDSIMEPVCFGSCVDCLNLPSEWQVQITSTNHTVILTEDMNIIIDSISFMDAVYVGFFYTNEIGQELCAGYTYFNGEVSQISVMGDDPTTYEIDGYQSGQYFVIKIFDGDQSFYAQADFIESNLDFYETNGMSFINSLTSIQNISYEQLIDLPVGWSFFSTYILEDNMDVAHVLEPIVSDIIIVKNNNGAAYLPSWAFNGIGDFLIGNGYQIKTSNQCSLVMQGDYTSSDQYPTLLTEGWNMIGYLKNEPISAEIILNNIVAEENLIIAKDENGAAYLPQWNFNGIGDFKPGKGYQVKVYFETYLSY